MSAEDLKEMCFLCVWFFVGFLIFLSLLLFVIVMLRTLPPPYFFVCFCFGVCACVRACVRACVCVWRGGGGKPVQLVGSWTYWIVTSH